MLPEPVVDIVGTPLQIELLKNKPGRRQTVRASGPLRSVIVKTYASNRAPVIAERVAALRNGPAEPVIPRVIYVDPERRFVVLSDVTGRPLREAVLNGELSECRRTGAALARWHMSWAGGMPSVLRAHTLERELAILVERASAASAQVAAAVERLTPEPSARWTATTVVHRDLYDEQVLLGDRIGLIDLDDAAAGPPELDVGNLVAHMEWLGFREHMSVRPATVAVLDGYLDAGGALDTSQLERCRSLSLLRLACLNDELRLVELAGVPAS
jgi:Ser/Thr protein kinase RdoA (MazF antagonist)